MASDSLSTLFVLPNELWNIVVGFVSALILSSFMSWALQRVERFFLSLDLVQNFLLRFWWTPRFSNRSFRTIATNPAQSKDRTAYGSEVPLSCIKSI